MSLNHGFVEEKNQLNKQHKTANACSLEHRKKFGSFMRGNSITEQNLDFC